MGNVNSFNAYFTQLHSSEGECVVVSTLEMLNYIFSREARLKFNYGQFEESFPDYDKYIRSHRVECENEWTILMDEPDRNLSIDNIMQIESILSFHKPKTQIIAVIHNPLLIYKLSKNNNSSVNFKI